MFLFLDVFVYLIDLFQLFLCFRPQRKKDVTHLATIEAIYYFFREMSQFLDPSGSYDGEYDNLLYFYAYQYNIVSSSSTSKHLPWNST